jgi:hypothetical protein
LKELVCVAILALGGSAVSSLADDLKLLTKAPPALAVASPPAVASPWDVAFGSGVMSDYNFRGITQSNHQPSVAAYIEPRYNFNDRLQGYAGVSGESIDFPNRAAGEVDFYGGIRPIFGKLALDFGAWYYWYPGGECFNDLAVGGPDCAAQGPLPGNRNVDKADLSFWEIYGKATYAFTDAFAAGGSVFYSPSVENSGADGIYLAGNAKYTLPGTLLPGGIGAFISADVGHWFFGTTDSFYCTQTATGVCGGLFPGGIPYKSYTNWDIGLGLTWKQFTLDLRYFDTDLSKGDCNAFTSAQTGSGTTNVTAINPGGAGSNWCGAAYIAKLSVDLTLSDLK